MSANLARACAAIVGERNVIADPTDMASYNDDFWGQYSGRAAVVVRPDSTAQVSQLVVEAARHGASVVPQGGNTGLVNGGIPDASGRQMLLSLDRMHRIRSIEARGDFVVVDAGAVLADVQRAAEDVGRYFPLTLGAEGSCRIGGNVATNAGGSNVLRYGMMRDLILGLEVVLADGRIWNGLRTLRKDNTGYDLKQLFIGSEGTLGIVTAAALRLVAKPRERVTVWLSLESAEQALTLFSACRSEFGELLSSFELIHSNGVELAVKYLDASRRPVADPHPWHILVELAWTFTSGLKERVEEFLGRLLEAGVLADGAVAETEAHRVNMWRIREGQSEAARQFGMVVRSDVSVSIERIPELLRNIGHIASHIDPGIVFMPFGHVGDGNLHINFVLPRQSIEAIRTNILEALYKQVIELGGSVSAEHGVGRIKIGHVMLQKSPIELEIGHRIKSTLDPGTLFNPGTIFEADGTTGC